MKQLIFATHSKSTTHFFVSKNHCLANQRVASKSDRLLGKENRQITQLTMKTLYKENRQITRLTKKTRFRNNQGQGMVEYILIVGLIALFVFAAVKLLGTSITAGFTKASTQVTTATSW